MAEVLIRGGTVVDGTGETDARRADVAIDDGRVAAAYSRPCRGSALGSLLVGRRSCRSSPNDVAETSAFTSWCRDSSVLRECPRVPG